MFVQMATVLEIPGAVLVFSLKHWPSVAVGVWGLGFAFILYRSMRRWYSEDASEARLSAPGAEEEAIYSMMKKIASSKRSFRAKEVFVRALFWLPILSWGFGKKLARLLFYPILLVMDREKEGAVRRAIEAIEGNPAGAGNLPHNPAPVDSGSAPKLAVPCSFCGGTVVGIEMRHICHVVPPPCKSCGAILLPDRIHSHRSKCVTCENEIEAEKVHRCPGKENYCSSCDVKYGDKNPHEVIECRDCDESHCVEAGCP